MLWLAGLIGIVGAGAASVVITPAETDQPDDDETNAPEPEVDHGNLLDHIAGLKAGGSSQLDTLVSDLDALGDRHSESFANTLDPHEQEVEAAWPEHSLVPFPELPLEGTAEQISLGDWITEGKPAEAVDYDAVKDSLVLVWDDLDGPAEEPEVHVETDPFDDEVKHVVMNESSVAEVYDDPDLSTGDITMIPLSSALIVGLEPA